VTSESLNCRYAAENVVRHVVRAIWKLPNNL